MRLWRKIMKNKQIHSDYPQNVKTLFSNVLSHPKTAFFIGYSFSAVNYPIKMDAQKGIVTIAVRLF